MAWGMPLATFTFVHVVLSLVGIGAGLLVLSGLLSGRERNGWTALLRWVALVSPAIAGSRRILKTRSTPLRNCSVGAPAHAP